MAAHILTALKQTQEDIAQNRVTWSHLVAACEISCWTEGLDMDEWRELLEVATTEDITGLTGLVERLLPKYQAVWEQLNQPRTREEWVDRYYHQKCARPHTEG